VFLVDLSPFVAHKADVCFCLHKVNVPCTSPTVNLLLVEYYESVTIFLRIWTSLHLSLKRLSYLWTVACFALRQNIAFDRLLTIADKRVGAAQSYSRYCSSCNAVTVYAAHFDLFCTEYSQDKWSNLIIVHLFFHIYIIIYVYIYVIIFYSVRGLGPNHVCCTFWCFRQQLIKLVPVPTRIVRKSP